MHSSSGFFRRAPKLAAFSIALGAMLALSVSSAWPFPWDIDMYRGEAVQPLSRAPRVMPSGTLPTDRGEPPASVDQMAALKNPLSSTPENLAHGKDLFLSNCAPCHGESGIGNGPVVHLLKESPKNLIGSDVKVHSDGFIYGVIRDGFELMPAYGDAMSSSERWQVVLYVRLLQSGTSEDTAKK
ncbi:MAG TPA: cytochrome c [Candidatus Binataceae bacterium]|nr:cytochrome c [Candidatus Binataceae bacterium]